MPNRMNFRKSAIFNPKIYAADFGNFKQGFLIIKLQVISGFRICFSDNCSENNQNTSESPIPPPWNFSENASVLVLSPVLSKANYVLPVSSDLVGLWNRFCFIKFLQI